MRLDEACATDTVFKGRIAHGMLTAGFISAVLGTRLPGPGAVYLRQELTFLAAVKIGDTITARVEVTEIDAAKGRVRLLTTCDNQEGKRVLTGEAVVAFVVLKSARPSGAAATDTIKQLQDWVGKEIGPIAKPKDIRFGDNLPKTRSGKIMRRLLRSIAKGEEITQDVSTLENPGILEQLKQVR